MKTSELLEGLDLSRFLLPGLQLAQLAIEERIREIQNGNGATKKRGRPPKSETNNPAECRACHKIFKNPNAVRKCRIHERLVHKIYIAKRRKKAA